jgi:peptide/nickel transport system substrate-binding protein
LDIFRYVFASESFPPHGGNRGWYSNPHLDKILEDARRNHDFEKRKPLYFEVQKIIDQDLPYAFLWHEKNFVVHNKAIKGFELFADGRYSSLVNVTR